MTSGQKGRAWRRFLGQLRDCHAWRIALLPAFQPQFESSQPQNGTWRELEFLHGPAVNERAVAGPQIAHENGVVLQHDLAMKARDSGVAETKIIRGIPPDGVEAWFQLEGNRVAQTSQEE